MKVWGLKLISIFIGILIFFAIGEIGYRLYVYLAKPLHRPSSIPTLLWEPTPGANSIDEGVRYKINSKGLRDYEYAVEKPKGVFRIAVIGDSVTWGDGVELKETYPKVIERELRLRCKDRRFEVLNFGIGGTGSQHHLGILRERVLSYEPDLVVLGYCLNDIRFTYINPAVMWFLQHSNFADFIAVKSGTAFRILQVGVGLMTDESYYLDHLRLYRDQDRVSRLKGILKEMDTIMSARGKRFAVVIFPFIQQFDRGASVEPQKTVSTICLGERILILDLLDKLKSIKPERLYLKEDPVHFSPFGNETVAKAIVDFLQSEGLL